MPFTGSKIVASQAALSAVTPAKDQTTELSLPALYRDLDGDLQPVIEASSNYTNQINGFLLRELDLSRLNQIHEYLWLAGRPVCARALHRQVLIGRELVITEQVDLHLVWQESRMFLKPLPDFLMSYEFWERHICHNPQLRTSAAGLLLSYAWLISHPSDLAIAHEKRLISAHVGWDQWIKFVQSLLGHIEYDSLSGINDRYQYGELRLSRLNWLYRAFSTPRKTRTVIRGYALSDNQFWVFVRRNFGWLLVTFIYITIVLTAMQVGLATDRLNQNPHFQNASYGFTVFSILAPLVGLAAVVAALMCSIVFNFFSTLAFKQEKVRRRQILVEQRAIKTA